VIDLREARRMDETTPEDVIRFWLGEPGAPPLAQAARWWKKDDALDKEIRARFEATLERGVRGELEGWQTSPRGRLALVLLYDQLSRNMFRGTARSFAQDPLARAAATKAFEAGDEQVLAPVEVGFLLMPFMHAEDLELQRRCIVGFEKLRDAASDDALRANFASSAEFGLKHEAIIARFGRFPHRNAIVGRTSTPEEEAFLEQPGSSF
jgi:uncharacterized protein (DUF924 family)